MEFRQLETFCKIFEERSFSKAARRLGMTQPTASAQIITLEKEIGVKLFDRSGKKVLPTSGGKLFYSYAKKILSMKKESIEALNNYSNVLTGNLYLCASTIPGEYLLPPIIGNFNKNFPNVSVFLKITDTGEVVEFVAKGEDEIGVLGARVDDSRIEYLPFTEDIIVFIAPYNHPLTEKKDLRLEDILEYPFIIREQKSGTLAVFEKKLKEKGYTLKDLKIVARMGSTNAVKEAVRSGVGISIISKKAILNEVKWNVLTILSPQDIEEIHRNFYIILPKNRTLSPAGKKFLAFLRQFGEE